MQADLYSVQISLLVRAKLKVIGLHKVGYFTQVQLDKALFKAAEKTHFVRNGFSGD